MSGRRILPDRRPHTLVDFEHDGIGFIGAWGTFPNGNVSEIFLDCAKRGSAAETSARDSAVLASLCLQHGLTIDAIGSKSSAATNSASAKTSRSAPAGVWPNCCRRITPR